MIIYSLIILFALNLPQVVIIKGLELGGRSSVHPDLAPYAHREEFRRLDLSLSLFLIGAPRDLKDIAFVFLERCSNPLCDSFQT